MNKCIFLGRLTKDVELRYAQSAEPIAIANYTLAVNRQFAKPDKQNVDFINIRAFGKAAEFASKWFSKGQLVAVTGRLQIENYEKDGEKRQAVYIAAEEQHFAESNKSRDTGRGGSTEINQHPEEDDDLPF